MGSRACLSSCSGEKKRNPPPSRSISMGASSAVFLIPLPMLFPPPPPPRQLTYVIPGPISLLSSLAGLSGSLRDGYTWAGPRAARDQLWAPLASRKPSLFSNNICDVSKVVLIFISCCCCCQKKKRRNPRFLCNQRIRNFTLNDIFPFFFSSISFYGSSNYTVQFRAINVCRNVCSAPRPVFVVVWRDYVHLLRSRSARLNGVSSLFLLPSFFLPLFRRWLILIRDKRINGQSREAQDDLV